MALRDPAPGQLSCILPTDCDDGDVCTTDLCDLLTFTCKYTPVASCCNRLGDCAGAPLCTVAKCITHLCLFEPILGCGNDGGSDGSFVDSRGTDGGESCTGAGDCDDADPCSLDLCVAGLCAHTDVGGCCQAPQECNDGPLCTLAKCILNTCVFDPIVGCDAGSPEGGATDGPTSLDTATDIASDSGGSGVCNPSDGLTCGDSDSCTLDVCLPVIFECVHAPLALCCNPLHACPPGQSCVNGTCTCGPSGCDGGDAGSPPTCTIAADCDDSNDCTFDVCAPGTNICAHAPLAGCGATDGGPSSDVGNDVSLDASSDAATDISSTTDTATDARVTDDTDASLDTTATDANDATSSTDAPFDVFAGDAVDGRADGTGSPDGLSDTTGRDMDGTYDGADGSAGAVDGASSDRAAGGAGGASDSGARRDVSGEGGESDVAWDLRGGCSCRLARSEDHTPAVLLWNAVALGVAVMRRRRKKH